MVSEQIGPRPSPICSSSTVNPNPATKSIRATKSSNGSVNQTSQKSKHLSDSNPVITPGEKSDTTIPDETVTMFDGNKSKLKTDDTISDDAITGNSSGDNNINNQIRNPPSQPVADRNYHHLNPIIGHHHTPFASQTIDGRKNHHQIAVADRQSCTNQKRSDGHQRNREEDTCGCGGGEVGDSEGGSKLQRREEWSEGARDLKIENITPDSFPKTPFLVNNFAFNPSSFHTNTFNPADFESGKDENIGFANMAQLGNRNQGTPWIFDCGATDTMSFDKSDFVSKSQPLKTCIRTANNEICDVKGGGTIEFSPTLKLSNCLYVPSLSHKLLSISHVTKK